MQAFLPDPILSAGENVVVGCAAPLFDVKKLETLSGADKIFTAMLIVLFICTTPMLLYKLENSAAFVHCNHVVSMAQKLKSSVDSLGIDAGIKTIREIEHHAKFADKTSLIPPRSRRFILLKNQTIDEMKRWFCNRDQTLFKIFYI